MSASEVRGPAGSGPTIVVGIDGTPPGQAALTWAGRLARATGWTVRAVHVLTWPIGVRDLQNSSDEVLRLDRSRVEEPYLRGMQSVFDEVDPDASWTLDFAQGDPGSVLTTLSVSAELLVIGSRERVTGDNYLAGAVSRYCTSHAVAPVTVVPGTQSPTVGDVARP